MSVAVDLMRAVVPRPVRNSLRSPTKSLRWVWDSARFRMGSTRIVELVPNWPLVCHPRVYRLFVNSQMNDPDQHSELEGFASLCHPGMHLFDIGASYGVYSLTAAHFGGRAVAVDPSPIAIRHIKIQSSLNHFEDRIRIVQACVSDRDGRVEMLSAGIYSDGYFKVVSQRSERELTGTDAITVDDLSQKFGYPTHLKIDVEGYEAAVIHGAKKTLVEAAPLLFLEVHNDMIREEGGDPGALLEELNEIGYRFLSSAGAAIGTAEIVGKPIIRVIGRPN